MHGFTAGQFDVLLCTTIVESGVDIPRANTIIIDRAERFGIADLYQLRGRVGRSNRKGYAYLLLPASGIVDTEARRRISAVKKHSQLGSGFQLALRDLEIRGSGNLLGAEQSGHISAVGFGLYCQLLQQSVARLKGRPLPVLVDVETRLDFIDLAPATATHDTGAFIPYAYIEDERLRLGVYRKIAEATALRNLTRLQHELTDRYGAIPAAVMRLLKMAELRILAAAHHITQIETRGEKVFLTDRNGLIMQGTQLPRLRAKTAADRLDELVALVRTLPEWRRKE
jgi:transcription-repair coupling factor (superfamily II helicase)